MAQAVEKKRAQRPRSKSSTPSDEAPSSMAMAFDAPAGGVDFAPMDALDEFRRKKVLAFRIKWLNALEQSAQRELHELERGAGKGEDRGASDEGA
jgi:hypothetical protein